MKLACIIPTLNGGGAERVMARLCSELSKRNHHITLVTLDDGLKDRHLVDPAVDRICLGVMGSELEAAAKRWPRLRRIYHAMRRISRLRATIKCISPDAIISFCDQMNVMTLIASARIDIPTIVCERSDPRHQPLTSFWERLRAATYPKASKVIALTDEVADYLRHNLQADSVAIPSAVDVAEKLSDRTTANREKKIVAIGRLEKEKGFERLLHAFAETASSYPEWTLHLIGDGSMKSDLKAIVERMKLNDRITMYGWLKEPWQSHLNSTLFVLPSLYEGFPSVLMEAMARGIPSVAVDCDSGPRAIVNGVKTSSDVPPALLVPNHLKGLVEGLKKMMSDASYREAIGAEGKQVSEHFGWNEMISQYEAELIKLAKSK